MLDRVLKYLRPASTLNRAAEPPASENPCRAALLIQLDEPRRIALRVLAADKARTDLPRAFKMLGELSPEVRDYDSLRLASRAPDLSAPIVRDVVQQAVASYLKARLALRNQDIMTEFLDALDTSQMSALAPAFKGEPSEFAWQLLRVVARDQGLDDDPLWQRVRGVNAVTSIPWAPTMLADAQRSESEQPKLLPPPPLPAPFPALP